MTVPVCDGCGNLCTDGNLRVLGKVFCFRCLERAADGIKRKRRPRAGKRGAA